MRAKHAALHGSVLHGFGPIPLWYAHALMHLPGVSHALDRFWQFLFTELSLAHRKMATNWFRMASVRWH